MENQPDHVPSNQVPSRADQIHALQVARKEEQRQELERLGLTAPLVQQATSTIEAQGQGSSRPRVASNQVAPTPGPHSVAPRSKAQTRQAAPKTTPSASSGKLKFLKLQFQPSGKEAFTLHVLHDPVDKDPTRATSFILREAWQVLAKGSVSESGFKKQSAKIIKVEGFATAPTTPEQFALCKGVLIELVF